jgi:prepilin-type N-terminal cleavage/methylation domain-containing protein
MKRAFTLLELVFVIVVIGILAAVIIPKTKTNPLQEAAVQIISHIRYTQHLALIDDKFDPNDQEWYKKRWQIIFNRSKNYTDNLYAYTIFSDTTKTGNPDVTDNVQEVALNPLNRDIYLSGGFAGISKLKYNSDSFKGSKEMNLGDKYAIDNIVTSGCKGKRVAFDHLGRPYVGNSSKWKMAYDGILNKQCRMTFSKGDENITIAIEPGTGYAHILK